MPFCDESKAKASYMQMRTSLCFLCYTKRDKRASIRVDNATYNLLFFFFSFLFSLRFSIVNTNLFREPDRFVFVTLSQTHPCTQATEFNYSILNFSLSKLLFIKRWLDHNKKKTSLTTRPLWTTYIIQLLFPKKPLIRVQHSNHESQSLTTKFKQPFRAYPPFLKPSPRPMPRRTTQ